MKPLVVYAVEHGIAKEQMRGKWASSCIEFGYTDLLCIPELTSEFISSCECSWRLSGVLSRKFWLLTCLIRNSGLLCTQCRESKPHLPACYVSWDFSSCGRILGYILELQWGWPFETPLCSVKSGLLCSYEGHLRK